MCIYCGTNKYRKIYEKHYGPIPKDENNRSYEIHHLDKNHQNNNPLNLIAVTIQEHYNLHYAQGNLGACYKIARRMEMSPEELSNLAREIAKKLLSEGRHNFQLYRLSSEEQSLVAKK